MSVRRFERGVTIIEMMLVMVITSIIFLIVQFLLSRTIDNWWKVNANADAQQQLYKAQMFLERDLSSAAFEVEPTRATVAVEQAPAKLVNLTGSDGDVFWFLSAIDPVTGEFVRCEDGQPHWQRNVLYYAASPTGLSAFNYLGAGTDVGGYEVSCPFKVLIRKEINFDTDPDHVEPLMPYSEIENYLQRPDGYDVSSMAGPNVSARPISGNIVTFRVDLQPFSDSVVVDLRATAIDRARREGRIETRNLVDNPASQQLLLSLYPPNRQRQRETNGDPVWTCNGPVPP